MSASLAFELDDFIEYRLYFPDELDSSEDQSAQCLRVLNLVSEWSKDYLWHYDAFNVVPWSTDLARAHSAQSKALKTKAAEDLFIQPRLSQTISNEFPPHLYGRLRFGDNLEDEWYVVHLLFELSKEIPGLVISVEDADGQFLLIEAAEALPEWLSSPDDAINRVYIANGALNIIPLTPNSPAAAIDLAPLLNRKLNDTSDDDAHVVVPSVSMTVSVVRKAPHACKADGRIQQLIDKRIAGFTRGNFVNVPSQYHYALAHIPVQLATVLRDDPSIISEIVRACVQSAAVSKAKMSSAYYMPTDLKQYVTARIRFTRCLYAQLSSCSLAFPKGFEPPRRGDELFKSKQLGMKLILGAEFLCKQNESLFAKTSSDETAQTERRESAWLQFLKSLHRVGYFPAEEIEGSKRHQELMASAREYFDRTQQCLQSGKGSGSTSARVHTLTELVNGGRQYSHFVSRFASVAVDVKNPVDAAHSWSNTESGEDSDAWLYVSPEEVDSMLESRLAQPAMNDPGELLSRTKEFFADEAAGIDGAEYTANRMESETSLDPKAFVDALEQLIGGIDGLEANGEGDDDFDDEDYAVGGADTSDDEDELEMAEYTKAMAQELAQLSSQPTGQTPSTAAATDGFSMDVVQQLLESFATEEGDAGPATALLSELGFGR